MLRDGTKHGHIHLNNGDIIYLKDLFSEKQNRILTAKEYEVAVSKSREVIV